MIDLNKAIKEAKEHEDFTVKIQGIPEDEMCFGVITDASYANTETYSSQGGSSEYCATRRRWKRREWAEGTSYTGDQQRRIVNSTLAAETQSLAKGLQELAWSITVYNELGDPNFELKEWEAAAKKRRLKAIAKEDIDETLMKGLCLVDAKSLYDHLVKSTVGSTEDRRTAIEMQLARQSMQETGTGVRWVNQEKMLVDCLTKRSGNKDPLYRFLATGILNFSQCDQQKMLGAVKGEHDWSH